VHGSAKKFRGPAKFADTADVKNPPAERSGTVDGVTTNPSLISEVRGKIATSS
jgi:transaldolase